MKTYEAYFKVEATVILAVKGEAAASALDNSEVLHPDVLDIIANAALNSEPLFTITLDEVLEINEEEVNENGKE